MAYLAWWPEWLHVCELNDWWTPSKILAASALANKYSYFLIYVLVISCSSHTIAPFFSLFITLISYLFLFLSLFVFLAYCLYFLFYFCQTHLPFCQHFTVDIQLLAGHSSDSIQSTAIHHWPQTAIQITSSAASRVAAVQNVVFKHFWGHHLIWSPRHNWMSVFT